MSNEEVPSEDAREAIQAGGILCIIGLYLIIFQQDYDSGFFLFGLGIVILASSQWSFTRELWRYLFDKFKKT